MTTIFTDGFDKYGITNDTNISNSILGEWTSVINGTTLSVVNGLSTNGHAINLGVGTTIFKIFDSNYSPIIGGIRFSAFLNNSTNYLFSFGDNTTIQCTITININGTISLKNGTSTGTTIASGGNVNNNSVNFLEWNINIGSSAEYNIYLNGISIISGTGNTVSTSNNYINYIQFGSAAVGSASLTIDDLYLFDNTTDYNNDVLLTNPRIETQFPTSDSQTQWTNNGSILGIASSSLSSTFTDTGSPGANILFLRKYTSSVVQTINSISCMPAANSATINYKAVIYSDNAGVPDTLLSSGTQITGATSGIILTGLLTTPQSLSAATPYWIGFITDTSLSLLLSDNIYVLGYTVANTYTSGAPSTAPTMAGNKSSWILYGNCTGASTNYETQNINPPPGNISSITSNTVNDEDLYGFPNLTTSGNNIYTIAVKTNTKLNSTGVRTLTLQTKSGDTDGSGSNAGSNPTNSYLWIESFFDTDPNTGDAWTAANVNAAVSGSKITA